MGFTLSMSVSHKGWCIEYPWETHLSLLPAQLHCQTLFPALSKAHIRIEYIYSFLIKMPCKSSKALHKCIAKYTLHKSTKLVEIQKRHNLPWWQVWKHKEEAGPCKESNRCCAVYYHSSMNRKDIACGISMVSLNWLLNKAQTEVFFFFLHLLPN